MNDFLIGMDSSIGKIDMIHRSKPVNGRDEKKMYNDCTYFGAVVEKRKCANGNIIDKSVFVVTRYLLSLPNTASCTFISM